jgi:hypothetical protein
MQYRAAATSSITNGRVLAAFLPAWVQQPGNSGNEMSKQLPELFDGQSSVADDAAHCEGVHWVVTRNRQNPAAVRHDECLPWRMI